MLVLMRRKGEVVEIGPDIRVMVTKVRGGAVKLGITAPREIAVHRSEIGDRIRAEAQVAGLEA